MIGTKDHRFYFRLTATDRDMLEQVSEAMGVSPSGVIRVLLREKHREIFSMQPAPAQQLLPMPKSKQPKQKRRPKSKRSK
jgi:hypothetical protein